MGVPPHEGMLVDCLFSLFLFRTRMITHLSTPSVLMPWRAQAGVGYVIDERE